MRVAILADTHGFVDPRVAECVAHADVAVHAGDIGGADVLLALQPREELVAIRGNNDTSARWSEGERHMLETLPREASVNLPGGRLVVVHGDDGGTLVQRARRYRRRFPDAGAVAFGHSHRLATDLGERPWLLNPGAAGRTRTNGGPSLLLLECTTHRWNVEAVRFPPRRTPPRRRRGAAPVDDESE
ncbi:metallophosphoesterase family protein [Arhodomonas sp. SL1]|uniref:metallophosphoesterase family protein n=1 Tax=Arhodomonas sp. SL1 TaxID=3425691 RepID=UPI003F881E02